MTNSTIFNISIAEDDAIQIEKSFFNFTNCWFSDFTAIIINSDNCRGNRITNSIFENSLLGLLLKDSDAYIWNSTFRSLGNEEQSGGAI